MRKIPFTSAVRYRTCGKVQKNEIFFSPYLTEEQAVSKWETGTTVPDLDVLLKISKLYDITINDILEPKIQPQRITDFEQISKISEKELKVVLEQFDANLLVTALMGASPETNRFCERLFPDIDFEMARKNIGSIRIEVVEDIQNQIIAMINLQRYMTGK